MLLVASLLASAPAGDLGGGGGGASRNSRCATLLALHVSTPRHGSVCLPLHPKSTSTHIHIHPYRASQIRRDVGDGTGIPFCYDQLYDSYLYDHGGYAFIWIISSILGVFLFGAVLAAVPSVPFIVRRQEELIGIITKTKMEVDHVLKGLGPRIIKSLEVIFQEVRRHPPHRPTIPPACHARGSLVGSAAAMLCRTASS